MPGADPLGPAPGGRRRPAPGRRPRLLFVVNQARFFLTHRLPLAEGAAAAGYDVHVAVPDGGEVGRIRAAGFPVHPVRFDRGGMNPFADARTFAALYRLYRRLAPAIVHHVTIKPVLYGSLAARAAGVPAVVNAVSGLGYLEIATDRRTRAVRAAVRALYARAFRHPAMRVIFQNPDDRAGFESAGIVAPAQAVTILGSGVDLAEFAPRAVPDGPPVVVLAARMLWDKGIGEFVEAARRLRADGADARFALVGDTDENPTAVPRALLGRWAQEGDVEWWGLRDDMPAVLGGASVVCLPSYREGCPKVLLEAAACGRAMVTTDVPGCRDVVRDGCEGRLVPARDAGALAAALAQLLRNPAERDALGRRARARAEREFGVGRVVAATLGVYGELVPAARPVQGALG